MTAMEMLQVSNPTGKKITPPPPYHLSTDNNVLQLNQLEEVAVLSELSSQEQPVLTEMTEKKENANRYYEAIIDLIRVYVVLVKNDTEKNSANYVTNLWDY